jgi:hypothetical protein
MKIPSPGGDWQFPCIFLETMEFTNRIGLVCGVDAEAKMPPPTFESTVELMNSPSSPDKAPPNAAALLRTKSVLANVEWRARPKLRNAIAPPEAPDSLSANIPREMLIAMEVPRMAPPSPLAEFLEKFTAVPWTTVTWLLSGPDARRMSSSMAPPLSAELPMKVP